MTSLDLARCRNVSDVGLGYLAHAPLVRLNLEGCDGLSDVCKEEFAGLQAAWSRSKVHN